MHKPQCPRCAYLCLISASLLLSVMKITVLPPSRTMGILSWTEPVASFACGTLSRLLVRLILLASISFFLFRAFFNACIFIFVTRYGIIEQSALIKTFILIRPKATDPYSRKRKRPSRGTASRSKIIVSQTAYASLTFTAFNPFFPS